MTRRKNYDSPFDKEDYENNKVTPDPFDNLEYIDRDDPYFFDNSIDNSANLPTRYLMTMTTLDVDNEIDDPYEKFKEDEGLK